ncbi:MAG TPA: hypothetical protein VFA60_01805 [Terriglobales bacterium]|nr:hypothetical protein [Terriglobales bacterium]
MMRRLIVSFCLLIAVSLANPALSQDTQSKDSQSKESQSKDSQSKDSKDKKKDDKKKKERKQDDELNTSMFSAAVANDVLGLVRDGLEGHSQRLMLSAFDLEKMDGGLTFEDQIEAMFQRYEGFRVHYRILQNSVEGEKAVVMVLFEMEELPKNGNAPIRKSSQVKFEMERGRKGWKITDFSPRGFFS